MFKYFIYVGSMDFNMDFYIDFVIWMNDYENDLIFVSFWIFVLFMSNVVVYYIYEISILFIYVFIWLFVI